jgi:hypothetical protein
MLLLAGIALLRSAFRLPRLLKAGVGWRHLPFAFVCGVLTILALSPGVTLGERLLFTYPAEWWGPLTLFRSSGRMFWPVYYAIGLGILTGVSRLGYRPALVLLTIALGLQAADLRGQYQATRDHRTLGFNNPLKSPFWRNVPPYYKRLTLVPTSMCTPSLAFDERAFLLLAGHHRLAVNAGSAARYDARKARQHCSALARQLRGGEVAPDELYVLSRDAATLFQAAAATALMCTPVDGFRVCFSSDTYSSWQNTYQVAAAGRPQ